MTDRDHEAKLENLLLSLNGLCRYAAQCEEAVRSFFEEETTTDRRSEYEKNCDAADQAKRQAPEIAVLPPAPAIELTPPPPPGKAPVASTPGEGALWRSWEKQSILLLRKKAARLATLAAALDPPAPKKLLDRLLASWPRFEKGDRGWWMWIKPGEGEPIPDPDSDYDPAGADAICLSRMGGNAWCGREINPITHDPAAATCKLCKNARVS